ncbi:MAG TPA: hypothetical protein VFW33_03450 [Gemmataceae bacterium]|nr:hypothetical protein [Gemmataceae bacterium]
MSLRIGLLACFVGLGAALLPGCATQGVMGIDPRDHVPDLPNLGADPRSPYHQLPDPRPAPANPVRPAAHQKPAADDPPPPKKEETPAPLPPLSPAAATPPGTARPAASIAPAPQERRKPAADEPLVVALRAYLQKRPADALDALRRYEKANQDMLLVALPFAARLTEGDIDKVSPREAAELADLMQGVEERLRQRAALRVEKMLFCRQIDDFGEYVPREAVNGMATFEGGAGDQPGETIRVYVELRNVSSRQRGDSYETRLTGGVELLDFDGRSVYLYDFKPEQHRGQSPRHDFFVNCYFSVPRNIPPGRYTLRVEVRDITGLPADAAGAGRAPPHRVAHQELDLQVIEPKSDRAAAPPGR